MRQVLRWGLLPNVETVCGVDFSGAKLAGRNAWIARCKVAGDSLELVELDSLGSLVGTDERDAALAALVTMIRGSAGTLWAMDFPFGLPLELGFGDWPSQLELVRGWRGGAYAFGLHCLETAKERCERPHVRRLTDVEERAPFDCYHYRIIYQTFHGMADVLAPMERDRGTAVLPFQRAKLRRATRVVVEACPSSTLKRLGLPHQNYKQPAGGPLTRKRLATRKVLFAALREQITASEVLWRRMARNPGGDAMDAVLAAVGGWHGFRVQDPADARRHPRYAREGRIFA